MEYSLTILGDDVLLHLVLRDGNPVEIAAKISALNIAHRTRIDHIVAMLRSRRCDCVRAILMPRHCISVGESEIYNMSLVDPYIAQHTVGYPAASYHRVCILYMPLYYAMIRSDRALCRHIINRAYSAYCALYLISSPRIVGVHTAKIVFGADYAIFHHPREVSRSSFKRRAYYKTLMLNCGRPTFVSELLSMNPAAIPREWDHCLAFGHVGMRTNMIAHANVRYLSLGGYTSMDDWFVQLTAALHRIGYLDLSGKCECTVGVNEWVRGLHIGDDLIRFRIQVYFTLLEYGPVQCDMRDDMRSIPLHEIRTMATTPRQIAAIRQLGFH